MPVEFSFSIMVMKSQEGFLSVPSSCSSQCVSVCLVPVESLNVRESN